jgi:hypothetical protein
MKRSLALVVAIGIGLAPLVNASDAPLTAIGEARDAKSGQLLYREYHFRNPAGPEGLVEYRGPDDLLMGTKSLDFSAGDTVPAFRQVDLRTGQLIFSQWQDDDLTLGYRDDQDDAVQQKIVDTQPNLVVDAGFDHFVRQNWSPLLRGDTISFDFAVASRLDTVHLVALQRNCDTPGQTLASVCFRVKPKNWLIAMLVRPIDLRYDSTSRELLQFSGISNITDANGAALDVVIDYRHAQAGGNLANTTLPLKPAS